MNPIDSDDPLILPLDDDAATLERVGGKGASLARMAAAGLPVPPGFHVTTRAYRRFVDENHLAAPILAAADRARPGDPASLDRASAIIRALIDQGTIGADVAEAIVRAYAALSAAAAGASGDVGAGGASGAPDEIGAGGARDASEVVGAGGTRDASEVVGAGGTRDADGVPVAVRSSATAEDLPDLSFAGQQETFLNVRGGGALLDAVKRCWASLWTARAIGYRARQGIPSRDVALAVVVQELVPADAAGILFTANPMTGSRDEIVINAAWGLGEAVVGGLVTPDTVTVDKRTGAVASSAIADKAVMTVRTAGGTSEAPVPVDLRRAPALAAERVSELARLGMAIEELYSRPMDVEWALHGGRVAIVQARPITALPEPRVALTWDLPRGPGMYARASVIELLPDPLSPLFASLALPYWNDGMRRLLDFAGLGNVFSDTDLVTINDYAFYHYGYTARQLLGIFPAVPGVARRMRDWFGRAEARWADEARPRYAALAAAWADRDLAALPAAELLDGAREITRAAADHYLTIQSGILPASYMSEALFTAVYERLLRRRGDPPALTFMLGFDSAPIRADKSLYDMAQAARATPDLADFLARTAAADIAAALQSRSAPVAGAAAISSATGAAAWDAFRRGFESHLERFGHAVYDLDFAKRVPADDPTPLIEALKHYLVPDAPNPHDRQAAAAAAREAATRTLLGRRHPLLGRLGGRLLGWAQRYAPLREDALADVGLGWPALRRMMREIGRRLVAAGALDASDAVFWLTADEVDAAARALDGRVAGTLEVPSASAPDAPPAGDRGLPDHRGVVAERRARWERERRVTPPVTLPVRGGARFMGVDFSRWMPARADQAEGDTLHGIGASPGRVTGIARVITGPDAFGEMRPGDVLVAKITTPAWTPLFALASGIVTDVGGPLSHGSIVAREYHIPAVLGTGAATARIQSGQRVTVDGDKGVVTGVRGELR